MNLFYAAKGNNADESMPLRILIASIRNLGICPCPRCCIPKKLVYQMGMARDKTQRVTLARVDDIRRQGLVTAARRIIYDEHYTVNSAAVEALLKDQSLTPNIVRFMIIHTINTTLIIYELYRMRFLNAWAQWALTSSRHCCPMKCMRLHLAYGEKYSNIYCEYWSQKTNLSY